MKMKIRVYKNFEEAEAEWIQAVIAQSPVKRLRQTVELILRVYGTSREELKSKVHDGKIKIRPGW